MRHGVVIPVLSATHSTFAANRARGSIAVSVAAVDGLTRRASVREEGSLRVRFPGQPASELEAIIVNTAGGMTGGDRFDLAFNVGAGGDLLVSTVAAEKVYRSEGADAAVQVSLNVAGGGSLAWLPQETILFDGARLRRSIDVAVSEGSSLLLAESVIFGRSAMGEIVERGSFADRWRVRRDGKLVFAENVKLDDPISQMLAQPAIAAGNAALASVLMLPGDEARLAPVRALAERFAGEVGASAWGGIAFLRFCAKDGAALRHDLARVLAALRGAALPRLWLN